MEKEYIEFKYINRDPCTYTLNPKNIIYGEILDANRFANKGCYISINCDVIFDGYNRPIVVIKK